MSMYPQELGSIPEETARIARAACPKGTLAMRLRDALADLYEGEQFAALIGVKLSRGQAAREADGRYSSASDAWEWSTLP